MPRLLGLPRFPSPDTMRWFFSGFTYRRTTKVSEALLRLSLGAVRPILLGHTLDLDPTVPLSHHPLVAWLSERRQLLWATLRAGHAGAANGAREFLAQALTMLPPGHRIGLVRADAGFCVTAFLTAVEVRELPYIIVARRTPLVRKVVLHRIPEADWRPVARGGAVADWEATLPVWRGQARRFVCLRQTLMERPTASGRRLIECPGYTYRVVVTSVPYAAEVVTRMYAGRADSENRIKELKEDLSLDTFCLQSFDGTDATFRTGCVLYNLLMGFRETVLPSGWLERRLRAVRDRVFLVGVDLIPKARRLRVRFAVPREERPEFLHRLRTLSEGVPIAAQLDWDLAEAEATARPLLDRLLSPCQLSGRGIRCPPGPHPNRIATAESEMIERYGTSLSLFKDFPSCGRLDHRVGFSP